MHSCPSWSEMIRPVPGQHASQRKGRSDWRASEFEGADPCTSGTHTHIYSRECVATEHGDGLANDKRDIIEIETLVLLKHMHAHTHR